MKSCIYEGLVRHTRQKPVLHRFSYRVFMMFLDLDELPSLFSDRWFWSARRPALARFRRALRREDQLVLDALFASAHRHLAAASYAAHVSPFETLLLAMLIEEHKEVLKLRRLAESLTR